FEGAAQPLVVGDGDRLFAHVYLDPADPPQQIMLQWNDGTWEHRAYWGGNHIAWGKDNEPSRRRIGDLPAAGQWVRLEVVAAEVGLPPGTSITGWAFTQFDGKVYWDTAGIVTSGEHTVTKKSLAAWIDQQRGAKKSQLPDELKKIIQIETDVRTAAQQKQLQDYFVEHVYTDAREIFDPLHKRIAEQEKQLNETKKTTATTQIFRERKEPRPAYVLHRGEYDKRREEVSRATPAVLTAMPDGAPRNRLGLAQWLIDPNNPLTARVTVNRFWQQLFGVGIVKTAGDFGSQGDVPSHPDLLDWLAAQFIADGWDVKQTMKRIVMSATYRQASRVTPDLVRRDPQNRLLARGPRYRLDAEMLRDQALAVSGLLVNKLGGPSVKPPQPDGLWFAVGYSGSDTVRFQADTGPQKVHRRTLYTFIKRTAPPPQMSTLDAPSRESCTVRRERTNTPLQALLMMNDPQFVEAARALAARVMIEGGSSPPDRARQMFRLCTGRRPDEAEVTELTNVFADHLAEYQSNVEAAQKLLGVGEFTPESDLDTPQWAAWTMVANLVLNLDEVLSKN
ncbi:MAG TPA: DUF1553 domain-containing protein, partial [Pirellulales bacterium]|nr:DUF1553 domain-containing protein [Pirellulales bacterium]